MKEALLRNLNRYVRFDDREFEHFYSCLEEREYAKKEYVLKEGGICRHYYFIGEGLLRSFYVDAGGKERLTQFTIENWWLTEMESFVRETPSGINIQTLEKTKVLRIGKAKLEELFAEIPKLERFFRILTQNMLIAIQKRNEFYMKMSSKQRYDSLSSEFPAFMQRVPQYMVASYLDISAEYLSELRRK